MEKTSEKLHRINYLTAEIEWLYHQASLRMGIADSTMRVLYTIYDHGEEDCPLSCVYKESGISKQTVNSALRRLEEQGVLRVGLADAQVAAQRSAMRYDREGDDHYDIASALMKSLRGSDPDAALHYLARLLEAGDMTTAIRRILCSASEDVGMAYPQAALIAKACVDNALQLGLPEAQLPLAQAVILLATAPKSNSVYMGIAAARADVRAGKTGDYPRHLQNVHADSAGMEREQGYLYPHDFPRHWVRQQYLPDILAGTRYYQYGDNKNEQAARRYWEEIKGPDA